MDAPYDPTDPREQNIDRAIVMLGDAIGELPQESQALATHRAVCALLCGQDDGTLDMFFPLVRETLRAFRASLDTTETTTTDNA